MRFAKGHGTGNDFVILPDPDGELDLTRELVAWLCDRHFGIGADGVLRVVRTAVGRGGRRAGRRPSGSWTTGTPTAASRRCAGTGSGSSPGTCSTRAWPAGPELAIATRAGTQDGQARSLTGEFTVDMGPATVLGDGRRTAGGQRLAGLAISVGNPHLACMIDQPVAAVDLTAPRVLAPAELAGGANIEVIRVTGRARGARCACTSAARA